MITIFIVLLVLICILLIAVVLLQASKGGGISSTFGGSNVTAVFGSRRTSDFLSKATIVLASIFLVASLLLNIYISKSDGIEESVIQRNAGTQTLPPPNVPMETPGQQPGGQQPPAGDQQNQQTTPNTQQTPAP
jgi:preprotein translocase subunit SecG